MNLNLYLRAKRADGQAIHITERRVLFGDAPPSVIVSVSQELLREAWKGVAARAEFQAVAVDVPDWWVTQ